MNANVTGAGVSMTVPAVEVRANAGGMVVEQGISVNASPAVNMRIEAPVVHATVEPVHMHVAGTTGTAEVRMDVPGMEVHTTSAGVETVSMNVSGNMNAGGNVQADFKF